MNSIDIKNVKLSKIETYLVLNRWIEININNNLPYKIFYKNNNIYTQVMMPKTSNKNNEKFYLMIEKLIQDISKIDEKSTLELFQEIANIDKQIIYIRYIDETRNDYNIPASAINDLIENSKKMFLSSYADANLIDERKSYRRGRYPKEIMDLESLIEFGQTLPGSYIIPMLIPSKAKNQMALYNTDIFDEKVIEIESENDPITKAIIQLNKGINLVKENANRKDEIEKLINPSNKDFVSVDFLSSLSNMISLKDNTIKVVFESSIVNNEEIIKSYITNNQTLIINEYIEEMKGKQDNKNEFTGKFLKLSLDHPDLINRETIIVELEGKPYGSKNSEAQKLSCHFNYYKYANIIFDAAENGSTVYVKGYRDKNKLFDCELEIVTR